MSLCPGTFRVPGAEVGALPSSCYSWVPTASKLEPGLGGGSGATLSEPYWPFGPGHVNQPLWGSLPVCKRGQFSGEPAWPGWTASPRALFAVSFWLVPTGQGPGWALEVSTKLAAIVLVSAARQSESTVYIQISPFYGFPSHQVNAEH